MELHRVRTSRGSGSPRGRLQTCIQLGVAHASHEVSLGGHLAPRLVESRPCHLPPLSPPFSPCSSPAPITFALAWPSSFCLGSRPPGCFRPPLPAVHVRTFWKNILSVLVSRAGPRGLAWREQTATKYGFWWLWTAYRRLAGHHSAQQLSVREMANTWTSTIGTRGAFMGRVGMHRKPGSEARVRRGRSNRRRPTA